MDGGAKHPDRGLHILSVLGWKPMPHVRDYGGEKRLRRLDHKHIVTLDCVASFVIGEQNFVKFFSRPDPNFHLFAFRSDSRGHINYFIRRDFWNKDLATP